MGKAIAALNNNVSADRVRTVPLEEGLQLMEAALSQWPLMGAFKTFCSGTYNQPFSKDLWTQIGRFVHMTRTGQIAHDLSVRRLLRPSHVLTRAPVARVHATDRGRGRGNVRTGWRRTTTMMARAVARRGRAPLTTLVRRPRARAPAYRAQRSLSEKLRIDSRRASATVEYVQAQTTEST